MIEPEYLKGLYIYMQKKAKKYYFLIAPFLLPKKIQSVFVLEEKGQQYLKIAISFIQSMFICLIKKNSINMNFIIVDLIEHFS
jgi:hypothetical protein